MMRTVSMVASNRMKGPAQLDIVSPPSPCQRKANAYDSYDGKSVRATVAPLSLAIAADCLQLMSCWQRGVAILIFNSRFIFIPGWRSQGPKSNDQQDVARTAIPIEWNKCWHPSLGMFSRLVVLSCACLPPCHHNCLL